MFDAFLYELNPIFLFAFHNQFLSFLYTSQSVAIYISLFLLNLSVLIRMALVTFSLPFQHHFNMVLPQIKITDNTRGLDTAYLSCLCARQFNFPTRFKKTMIKYHSVGVCFVFFPNNDDWSLLSLHVMRSHIF